MLVKDIMTDHPVTVNMDDSVRRLRTMFDKHTFHHLLVMHRDKLAGLVTLTDLLRESSPFAGTASEQPRDAAFLNKRVHQLMTRDPAVIGPKATTAQAAKLMCETKVSCLPVVDDHEKVVGIMTWRDLIKLLAEE